MASIYKAINAVMADIGAIQKRDLNTFDKYRYRGIDAVYNAVQPALVKNGVFIVPNLKEIEQSDRTSKDGKAQIHTRVIVEFTLYAEDASNISVLFPGEAVDRSDKSINKAMTAAYKYMIFELFCIPTEDLADADGESPDIGAVTNRDRLINFCRKHAIPMKEVANRFGLEKDAKDEAYIAALNALMDEQAKKREA